MPSKISQRVSLVSWVFCIPCPSQRHCCLKEMLERHQKSHFGSHQSKIANANFIKNIKNCVEDLIKTGG